jgi:hypothetical protein
MKITRIDLTTGVIPFMDGKISPKYIVLKMNKLLGMLKICKDKVTLEQKTLCISPVVFIPILII